jgi:DNA (cytosine-5)-methyltransferase 1
MRKEKITFIDLFAGIGGMRIAFQRAGGECILTCEIDELALKTYKDNFNSKNNHIYVGDIRKVKSKSIPDHDILIAGFPCQPYSIAGLRKGLSDERGKVFNDILRIIKDKRPKAFLLENVKGIIAHDQGKTFNYILKRLSNEGYHIKYHTLNSATHGNIPQNRERVFIVGFLDKDSAERFIFPKKIPLTIKFNQLLDKKIAKKYYYDDRYDCYQILKKDIKDKNRVYQWRRHYVRENKSGVCPTLTANMGSGGHNVPLIKDKNKIRKLTPKECLRLQGFPEEFILPNINDSHLYHQIGNSVTIPVIERLAKNIIKVLN